MIPVRDDTERERPALVALTFALLVALAGFVALFGSGGWSTALLLWLNAGAIWIYGAGDEARAGRFWTLVALLFGAAGGAALAAASGATGFGHIGAAAATGAAFEAIAVHLVRLRGSRITTLVVVPVIAGIAEIPATVWAAIWAAAALALGLAGAFGG